MATWFPHGINGNPVLPGGYAVVGELCACKRLWYSLIPRPSHLLVFDRLQCAKAEEEGLVHFIT